MKNYTLIITKLLFSTILLVAFLIPNSAISQKKKSKKTEEVAPPPAKKDKKKTIKELTKSSKKIAGLFTIYQDTITGSIQMLISEDQINKEYIYFSQIANGSLDAGRMNKGSYGGSKIFKIEKYFNRIEFITQNTSFYFDPNNAISKSSNSNISDGNMASVSIVAFDKEKKTYLIKADDLFLKETFTQIKPAKRPGTSPTSFSLGNLDKTKTKINAIRNFPVNTDLEVEYVYSKPSTLNGGSNAISDSRNVSFKIFHSLIAIPENDYEIRLDDQRVGYFLTEVTDQTTTKTVPYRDLIHRWNLVKKDPSANISEPVKPITWWMENTTPVEFRETIKEGVLRWNVAFEKAGFKNAMQVKMQPDSAKWNAGDIRYNVLRWTSSPTPPFGGYGPSFVNPRTGEILGADIMLEYVHFTNRVMYDKIYENNSATNNFENLSFNDQKYCSMGHLVNQNIQLGQTAITLGENSDLQMERMKKEAMLALIMHEVGHTLGLNHNMKASQLFSPEELADPDFIEGKCLTGSVMDYAGINLTTDREKQGQYFDTAVGPYDIWAIEFGYTPFKSESDREDLLSKSTQPELIFGNDADDMRSPGKAIDPRVNVSDLSNDAIQYSIDRIEMAESMMNDIKDKFTIEGQSYDEFRKAFLILQNQRAGAGNIISRYIGGVYVERSFIGQTGAKQPYTPVSLDDQKRAMEALSKYIFAPNAFKTPNEIYNYLAKQRRGFDFFSETEDPKIHKAILTSQKNVLKHIMHPTTLQRISDSQLYGNEYTLTTFMTDLNKAIFKDDINGNVNTFRQNLQIEYTHMLIGMLTGKQSTSFTSNSKSMALYNLKEIRSMASSSGNISSKAHKLHLRTLIDNAVKEIK